MSSRHDECDTEATAAQGSRWRWFEQRTTKLVFVAGALTTLLGVPSAVYGVYKLVHHEPTPIHLGLDLQPEWLINQSWASGHGRLSPKPETRPQPNQCGVVFDALTRIQGLSRGTATLSWTLRSPSNDVELDVPSWVPLSLEIRPKTDLETTQSIWVPIPTKIDKFQVHFRLAAKGVEVRDRSPVVPLLPLPEGVPPPTC
jgi:hypothetical protein